MGAFASVLLALLVLPLRADDLKEIHWAASYEAAFEDAKDRGVPVLIVIIQDREEASEDVWANAIQTPQFVKATRRTVNLIGNRGDEQQHKGRVEGTGPDQRTICGKFGGGISCLDHRKAEVGIFQDFAKGGVLKTPLVMLVLPDQTVVAELVDRNPMEAFLGAFEEARRRLPNGLDYDEAELLRDRLSHAEQWLQAGDVQRVIDFAAPFRKRDSASRLIRQAVGLLERIELQGAAELKEIEGQVAAKDFCPAMERLDGMVQRYRGTNVEKLAKERRAQLNKSKDVKAAVAKCKREEKAREMLGKADQLRDAGKADQAQRLYDSLLVNFGDTAAAEELRKRG